VHAASRNRQRLRLPVGCRRACCRNSRTCRWRSCASIVTSCWNSHQREQKFQSRPEVRTHPCSTRALTVEWMQAVTPCHLQMLAAIPCRPQTLPATPYPPQLMDIECTTQCAVHLENGLPRMQSDTCTGLTSALRQGLTLHYVRSVRSVRTA
jgi:hypothetical protein